MFSQWRGWILRRAVVPKNGSSASRYWRLRLVVATERACRFDSSQCLGQRGEVGLPVLDETVVLESGQAWLGDMSIIGVQGAVESASDFLDEGVVGATAVPV